MPYVFVSTLIRLENGPTIVGDGWSDRELMEFLDAVPVHEFGNNFEEYRSPHCARIILNKLEQIGYRVVAVTGLGQTCVWTCHREQENKSQDTTQATKVDGTKKKLME